MDLRANRINHLNIDAFEQFFNANRNNNIEIDGKMLVLDDKNIGLKQSLEHVNFHGINYDEIFIKKCPTLERIHWKAFGNECHQIKTFYAWNQLPNLKSETNTNYDLFKLINSLVNCKGIDINSFHNELQPIKLNKLKYLSFYSESSSIKITLICDFAFYECDQIESIDFNWNNISYISENAFHFKSENDIKLEIDFNGNKLDESSFQLNSLINIKRPTKFIFIGNNIRYLNKQVFKPFLDVNQQNEIEIEERYFDENHQSNQWIQTNEYNQRIM